MDSVPDRAELQPDRSDLHRPPLGLLIKYWYWGRLPERYSAWILHDVTCRTWLVRHFARWLLLIIAPLFGLYMVLMPASLSLRLFTGATFAGAILMFSIVNVLIDTDRRAVRAGYPYDLPARIRGQQGNDKHSRQVAERRERIAQRRAQRLG